MAEIFTNSGENSDNVVVPQPRLRGNFIPGIDDSQMIDGFGLVIPFGGGNTSRKYFDYGISAEVSQQNTQLNDLSRISPIGGATYNIEGLIGPQGPIGPAGPAGVIGITSLPYGYVLPANSNFLTELPHNIDLINDLGTAVDKLIYTSAYTAHRNFVWSNTPIDAAVSSWNDSDINTDASFFIIAADAGIYISTDDGDSWDKYNPDADTYIQANCAASGGKAVVLGDTERASGTILTTDDYGVNWSEKTVEVVEASASTKESQASSNNNNSITDSTFWVAQTWTTVSAYDITGVQLYLSRMGAFVGNVTIALRATDIVTGKPTGGDLASVTFDGSGLTTNSSGDGTVRNFDSPYSLSSGVKYAFIIRHAGIGYQNLRYRRQSNAGYSGGALHTSSDSGGTWGDASTTDIKFYIKGKGVDTASISGLRLGSAGDFLVATVENGVILSTDFGDNWTRKTPDGVETTDWIKGICSSDGTYIIVVSSANAIYRSANSGTAWAQITPAGGDTFSVNKMATSDDGQYMVIVGQNSTDVTESCYISTDYGATWTAKKPVTDSVEWTDCDISNDGTIIAVSTSTYFYISFDSGTSWLEQGMASSAEVWAGLSISGDGTTGLVANTNDNNEFFIGVNTELYSEATWAESALTSAGRALLGLPAATDGQLYVGSTGSDPVLATLTGTANQITVANAAGSITLATPQDTHVDAHMELAGLTIKDDGDNIIFYVDDDEMYFTASAAIPIEAGMVMGLWLFWGTYASS